MTKYKAATILQKTLDDAGFVGETKDAFEEGILALYKEYCRVVNSSMFLALRCSQCKKPILLQAENKERDNDYNITEYSAKCPYCGRKYEWNDCYWR